MTSAHIPPSADVVIVGAGSAGCVLAERLSREQGRSVILIDHGTGWPDGRVTDLYRLPIDADSQVVRHHPERSGLPVVRGRVLGGSSAVNGAYFLRWHHDDVDGWLSGWEPEVIDRAYDELDGGTGGEGGTMAVSAFSDDEIGPVATAFERWWARSLPTRGHDAPWPIVGVNRVRSNHVSGHRRTAADAYLRPASSRSNLTVVTGVAVTGLLTAGRRVTGVRVGESTVACAEVILSAGTLGTAELLLRSEVAGVAPDGAVDVHEHRELAVRYRPRARADVVPGQVLTPVLPTVVHTADGYEIRCYGDDFATYIDGMEPGSAHIGITAMSSGTTGTVALRAGGIDLDLGEVAAPTHVRMQVHARAVIDMLESAEFVELIEPGSVVVDDVVGTSQHAFGSMALGDRVDWLGAPQGIRGLRIVDGSILPSGGRSGPHATTMMMACRIGDVLAAG